MGANRYVIRFGTAASGERLLVAHDVFGTDDGLCAERAEPLLDRFDRTKGTVYGKDGSLEVYLQRDPPTDPRERANWLPAPAGRFYLVTRHYSPKAAVLTGDWRRHRSPMRDRIALIVGALVSAATGPCKTASPHSPGG